MITRAIFEGELYTVLATGLATDGEHQYAIALISKEETANFRPKFSAKEVFMADCQLLMSQYDYTNSEWHLGKLYGGSQ